MSATPVDRQLRFNGYHRRESAPPDLFLTQVGRGTPGGEYHRRFWQPIAYERELTDVPLRVRALGEDLVVFKTKRGEIGAMHLHCCHRNSSLEFGIIEETGIRCCYHGRLFGTDGTILEIPGDPAADRLIQTTTQGAYPTHAFGGLVFVYMGPPDRIPVFPMYDRLRLPGIEIVAGNRWTLDCNWMQVKENPLDPHHTSVLHVIPDLRGMKHFAVEFGKSPAFVWRETPGGLMYLAVRVLEETVWVRSAEVLGANLHCISSIFEDGRSPKYASPPFLSMWTLPVDDDHCITFPLSHVTPNEPIPFETRRQLEDFGQSNDRTYRERQWIPGDHEAQASQGRINVHALESLGPLDRGITMFRRHVRRGIEEVQNGLDPSGFYLDAGAVPPTFANDHVAPLTALEGDAHDMRALQRYAEQLAAEYLRQPPMARLG